MLLAPSKPCRFRRVTLILLASVWATPLSAPAEAAGRAADLVPAESLIAITVRDGDELAAQLRQFLARRKLEESKAYAALSAEPGVVQARVGILGFAAAAGTDFWMGLAALLGRDLVIGLGPGDGAGPGWLVAVVARDDALVERIFNTLHSFTGLIKEGEADAARSEMVDGVRVFAANPKTFHCRTDGVTLVSNSRKLITAALKLRESPDGRLSASTAYRTAEERIPKAAALWAMADVPKIRKLIGNDKEVAATLPNPLGAFLFGAWWRNVLNAEQALAWLTPGDERLTLAGWLRAAQPLEEACRGFLASAALPPEAVLRVPRELTEISITRDWRALWSEREKLMTLPAAGDLVNFATVLTTLMGQLDFVDDLLPALAPDARLIVARQDFEGQPLPHGRPTPELPAFALVTRLKGAAKLSQRLATATQMAVSFLNYDAAQKKHPSFVLGMESYRGCNVVKAEYALPPEREAGDDSAATQPSHGGEPASQPAVAGADIRFNFAPATAVVGDRFVIATTLDLLHDIIDATGGSQAPSGGADAARADDRAGPMDAVTIDLRETATILRANRQTLVANRMIEQNQSKAAAERFFDGFFDALRLGKALTLQAQCGATEAHATLELTLAAP